MVNGGGGGGGGGLLDNDKQGSATSAADSAKTQTQVGSTWSQIGNINLNLDNLLTAKGAKTEAAPSMNQLKTQSPVKQPFPPMLSTINNGSGGNNNNIPGFFGGSTPQQMMGGLRSPPTPSNSAFANANNNNMNFNAFQ